MSNSDRNSITYPVMPDAAPIAQWSFDQQDIWRLEQAYWSYCRDMDLETYLSLWHPGVIGWPVMYSAPTGKDHICDWLTDQARKGLTVTSYELEPLAIRVTENVAIVCYRVRYCWGGEDGRNMPIAGRITHTWMRSGESWLIIGGMSAPVDALGR
jgi:ketosteroid isomerase-like protein